MSILLAIASVILRPREAHASLRLVRELIDAGEDLVVLRARFRQDARPDDLDDSIRRLTALRRR